MKPGLQVRQSDSLGPLQVEQFSEQFEQRLRPKLMNKNNILTIMTYDSIEREKEASNDNIKWF